MNFKLSPETLRIIQTFVDSGNSIKLSKKGAKYYNSPEFYKRRPDLAPRDIYLSQGRVDKLSEARRNLANIGASPLKKLWNNIKYIIFKEI